MNPTPAKDAVDYALNEQPARADQREIEHDELIINKGWTVGHGVGLPATSVMTDEDQVDILIAMLRVAQESVDALGKVWTLDSLKLAPIGDYGRYPSGIGPTTATPKVPVESTAPYGAPLAQAVAVTLGTAKRGRGSTGRMFFPSQSVAMDGFTAQDQQRYRDAMTTFIEKVANPPGGLDVGRWNYRVVLMRRASVAVVASQHRGTVVNHVRVGDRIDIQRRRLNSRPETYVRKDVPNLD